MSLLKTLFALYFSLANYHIVASHSNVFNQSSIDLVCSTVKLKDFENIGELQTCHVASTTAIITDNIQIRNIIITESKSNVTADSIEAIYFEKSPELKFLPHGIKEKLPNLKALRVEKSNLSHVDQLVMKQFGSDLSYAGFIDTGLNILEGDLFIHNPNLIYVGFKKNRLEIIDPELFEHFEQMADLMTIDFIECNCINQTYSKNNSGDIKSFNWNFEKCNHDGSSKSLSRSIVKNFKSLLRKMQSDIKNEIEPKLKKIIHEEQKKNSVEMKNETFNEEYDTSEMSDDSEVMIMSETEVDRESLRELYNSTDIENEILMIKEKLQSSTFAFITLVIMILLTMLISISCSCYTLKKIKQ